MLWYRYRQVQGRHNRLPPADSGGAHVSKEPRMPKMDATAADMALAVWMSTKFSMCGTLEDMHDCTSVASRRASSP